MQYRFFNKNGHLNMPMPAHKCRLCITTMREVPEETGQKHFKKIKEEWLNINGKEFRRDITEDMKNNINHEIETVYQKPNTFVFNRFYLLATKDTMWVWILENEGE